MSEHKPDHESKHVKDVDGSGSTGRHQDDPGNVLAFYDVNFTYAGKKGDIPVIHGLDMVLRQGGIFAVAALRATDFSPIVGMLMRGYDYPNFMITEGQIWLHNQCTTLMKREKAAPLLNEAFVLAGSAARFPVHGKKLHDDTTVYDVIFSKKAEFDKERFTANLSALHFEDIKQLTESAFMSLSADERQRIKLARAMADAGDVLVLVDPTMNLNQDSRYYLQMLLEEKLREGFYKTVLLLTDDMEFAGETAEYLNVLDQGMVIERGSRDEIIRHSKNELLRSMLINI